MIKQIKLKIPECNYIRDPQETKLGNSIIDESIKLIDQIGFESFTFKKLAHAIGTTEASVYRYFENKYQLLLYLDSLYWGWMNYRISISTGHLQSDRQKLLTAFQLLIAENISEEEFLFQNNQKLMRIVQQEGIKSMLSKNVDDVNSTGAFHNYKELVSKLCVWILNIDPNFKHPNMLVTTIIEGAHIQYFFAEHLPRLTNAGKGKQQIELFFMEMLNLFLVNPTNQIKS